MNKHIMGYGWGLLFGAASWATIIGSLVWGGVL